MIDLNYNQLAPLARQVARSVSESFPSYVDRDDLEQTIHIWLLEKKHWLLNLQAEDETAFAAKVAPLMRKVAYSHANGEKAMVEGYAPEDVYRYSIEKIQTMIEDVFDYEDWQSFSMKSDGMPRSRGQANETGDRIAELVDIKAAIERLKEESYNLLVWRYKYNYSMADIGEEFEITENAAVKRHRAALRGVQKELGYRDPENLPNAATGRRTVRSNAAARAALSSNYEI